MENTEAFILHQFHLNLSSKTTTSPIQNGCRQRVVSAGGDGRLRRESGRGKLGRGGRQGSVDVHHREGAEDRR